MRLIYNSYAIIDMSSCVTYTLRSLNQNDILKWYVMFYAFFYSIDQLLQIRKPVIQSLWLGPKLSKMEQLSISSFLQNGHQFHLYIYEDVHGVPKGTIIKNAEKILPRSKVFRDSDRETFAGFSNFFRYNLLNKRGGYWVDLDVICLKKFDLRSHIIFASEQDSDGTMIITSCVLKTPPENSLINSACQACSNMDTQKYHFGQAGPYMLGRLVSEMNHERFAVPKNVFCPVPYFDWWKVISEKTSVQEEVHNMISHEVYAVHLWNEMWRLDNVDKNQDFHPDCFYETLKSRYLIKETLYSSGELGK